MRKMKLVLPTVALAGVMVVSGVQLATSAPSPALRDSTAVGRETGRVPSAATPGTVTVHGAPVRTYFSSGVSFATIHASPAAFGAPISVSCPGTTGKCKIEIDNYLQVGGNDTDGNAVAMWEVRDGSVASFPGGTYDEIPSDGGYQAVSFIESLPGVNHGTHRIQPMVAATGGDVSAYNFSIVIRVYKP